MRELDRHAGTQFDAPCVTALITSMEAIGARMCTVGS
jgi:hypothetical protein